MKTKLQMKQEGAIKRERAMVYALTHQVGQIQKSVLLIVIMSDEFVLRSRGRVQVQTEER